MQELLGSIFAVAQETLQSMRLVIASNTQKHESRRYEKAVHDYQKITLKLSKYDLLAAPISEFIATVIGLGIVVYALKSRVINPDSSMTAGDFVVYVAAMFAMMKPIKDLNSFFVGLQRSLVVAGRVFEIQDRVTSVQEAPDAQDLADFKDCIEYRNVSFAYQPGAPVIKNISFKIRKGEVVALVVPSGGGKTTLVDLLPRLYDPDSGAILLDGKDLREYKLSSLRNKMGIVTQETILFHDTVRNNIAYGFENADAATVKKAADVANATEFIENLPEKTGTVIGDRGARLSGGQRQRLCIARAILRNPEILIFDEATSALDNESEAKVQDAIDHLIENRTAVVIAHRLSTIKRASKIIVVAEGEIKEAGTHDELMRTSGIYKRLYDLQFRDA
jgi:subfamily B ATP-binding cassette protein MsbA